MIATRRQPSRSYGLLPDDLLRSMAALLPPARNRAAWLSALAAATAAILPLSTARLDARCREADPPIEPVLVRPTRCAECGAPLDDRPVRGRHTRCYVRALRHGLDRRTYAPRGA